MNTDRTTSDCPRCEAPVFLGAEYATIGGEPAHYICAAKHREDETAQRPRPIGALATTRAKAMLRGMFPDAELVTEPAFERSATGRRMLDDSHEGTPSRSA